MVIICKLCQILSFWSLPRCVSRSRRLRLVTSVLAAALCLIVLYYVMLTRPYLWLQFTVGQFADIDEINEAVLSQAKQSVSRVKGAGCELPTLEWFSEEVMQYDKDTREIACHGTDWVNCHRSKCSVDEKILSSMTDLVCTYFDILYVDDNTHLIGEPVSKLANETYELKKSDHVKISCTANDLNSLDIISSYWYGYKAGFRWIPLLPPRKERKDTFNVMILCFGSASRNGFIRRMPKSYKYLSDKLKAVILNGYSVVSEAGTGNLFPLFTGKSEAEQPVTRKMSGKAPFVDQTDFIFQLLKEDGYRTAYFEDTPGAGTFQSSHKGFNIQPTHHYLRALLAEESLDWRKPWTNVQQPHCIGAIPYYQLLLNLSKEFLELGGKKFCFTMINEVSHEVFNLISNADEATTDFLKSLVDMKALEDTLLIVMGDHGVRFGDIRNTYQGRLEERLPLMAIVLPARLQRLRPHALNALQHNKDVLTTPFDVHATLLDAVDLRQYSYRYKEPGADMLRAMTLLGKIPASRSCGEAGVSAHLCVCSRWQNVSRLEPRHALVAGVLADYIDKFCDDMRDKCATRQLLSILWVQRREQETLHREPPDERHARYFGRLSPKQLAVANQYYQAKIIMSPGRAVFEGTMFYNAKSNYFYVNEQHISRTTKYGSESACVSATHPHLNKFCYCKDKLTEKSNKSKKKKFNSKT